MGKISKCTSSALHIRECQGPLEKRRDLMPTLWEWERPLHL
jgi:hypothetical protein